MGPKPQTRSNAHGGYRHRYRIDGYESRRADPSGAIAFKLVIPTGFSGVEVAEQVHRALACEGFEA